MKKITLSVVLSAFILFNTSCSDDETIPVGTDIPGNQNPLEPSPNEPEEPLPITIYGDWKIVKKQEFDSSGVLLDERDHNHRCETIDDYYIIAETFAADYRHSTDCSYSIYESFDVVMVDEEYTLVANSFNYKATLIDQNNLQLRREYASPENNNDIAYFIIYLTK